MIISCITGLFAPSEHIRLIISEQCSFTAEQLAAFEGSLRRNVSARFDWLKFSKTRDKCDSEVIVVYQKGKQDKKILKRVSSASELNDQSIQDIVQALQRTTYKAGCN